MQYIKNCVNQSEDQLISLEGKITNIQFQKVSRIDVIVITMMVDMEEFQLYGYIQISKINVQKNFKYLITKIQVGTINNLFCGLLTPQTKIFCDKQDLKEIQRIRDLSNNSHLRQKSLMQLDNPLSPVINPFQINLTEFFAKDEFRLGGIMLCKLNQKLNNFQISTLVGYIYKMNPIGKNIIQLHSLDELTYTPFIIDLQYSDQQQINEIKLGYKMSFQNLQKQNRALMNSFKGFVEDQSVLQFDMLKFSIENEESLTQILQKLQVFTKVPYSLLTDIQSLTLDRQLRKFRTDIIKSNLIVFQYTCNICKGQIKNFEDLGYKCSSCLTEVELNNSLWEMFCIIYVKIGIDFAIVKLKDQLVLEYFNISPIYENFMQQSSLSSNNGLIREEIVVGDEKMKYLQQQFYKQQVSKEILAYPYCDFIKTAKTKEKWMQIGKLKKQEELNKEQLETDYQFSDYQVWIENNEYEKLIINPNGSFEQVIKDMKYDKWFQNRVLQPIICLECLQVKDIDIGYYNFIQSTLK